jgi:glycosyltransferase involved in cell wall biosynthesis
MNPAMDRELSIAFIGTYPPRRCGIATFGFDLRAAISGGVETDATTMPVVALERPGDDHAYPPEVIWQLDVDDRSAYRRLAAELNDSGVDAVILQHEYGIFGGDSGEYLLDLVERLRIPVISTLHTVRREPTERQHSVLRLLAERSALVVVTSDRARDILAASYGITGDCVEVIPHGVPDVPLVDPDQAKPRLGLEGRSVVLTFGLLSHNKRIEHVLEALAQVAPQVPRLTYVVAGATHPDVRRQEGEAYRESLIKLANDLGLERHVRFVDRYMRLDELVDWLAAADVFVTAYPGADQIVSGTLAYAVAAGKAIVSTPYEHAAELLADGRGVLVPFDDVDALAKELQHLLVDHEARDALGRQAYAFGRTMVWSAVGARYKEVVEEIVDRWRIAAAPRPPAFAPVRRLAVAPVARFHLGEMDHPLGMHQHAVGSRANPQHGFCTDDMARRLVVDLRHAESDPAPTIKASVDWSLDFLEHAWNPSTRRFRNFRDIEGNWLEEHGSEDSHGRAVQGLGELLACWTGPDERARAADLLGKALPVGLEFEHLRPWAYIVLGCEAARRGGWRGDTVGVFEALAGRISREFEFARTAGRNSGWPWPEPNVLYDNGVMPQALIVAGGALGEEAWVECGVEVLSWLFAAQVAPAGHLSPVGNRGWWPRGGRPARFDQQPIEAASLLEAARAAHQATGDPRWADAMERAYAWFLGANDLGLPLADPRRGTCRDGLNEDGINPNQGAESTLVWLLAAERIRELRTEDVGRQTAAVAQ